MRMEDMHTDYAHKLKHFLISKPTSDVWALEGAEGTYHTGDPESCCVGLWERLPRAAFVSWCDVFHMRHQMEHVMY